MVEWTLLPVFAPCDYFEIADNLGFDLGSGFALLKDDAVTVGSEFELSLTTKNVHVFQRKLPPYC